MRATPSEGAGARSRPGRGAEARALMQVTARPETCRWTMPVDDALHAGNSSARNLPVDDALHSVGEDGADSWRD
jgi:hypothetical protein